MAAAAQLYTPQMLALATRLAAYPLAEDLDLTGSARAPACGSRIDVGLALDDAGRIGRIGLRAQSCAVGQAAAALFADAAIGRARSDLVAALADIARWLDHGGALPAWPGFAAIAAAQAYPARHGAVLLPWKAALDAL